MVIFISVHLIQLLTTCGSFRRRLHIDFKGLVNLVNDVEYNAQLKASLLQRNLIYLDFDMINKSIVNSGAFHRVIKFLFNNYNNLRHITLLLEWDFELFGSFDNMIILMKTLCSFKYCTLLTSIKIYHCLFSNKFNNNEQSTSINVHFHQWLTDNTHLTFEHHFDTKCDQKHKTIKLWLK